MLDDRQGGNQSLERATYPLTHFPLIHVPVEHVTRGFLNSKPPHIGTANAVTLAIAMQSHDEIAARAVGVWDVVTEGYHRPRNVVYCGDATLCYRTRFFGIRHMRHGRSGCPWKRARY